MNNPHEIQHKPSISIIPGWSGNAKLWQTQITALQPQYTPLVHTLIDEDSIETMAQTVLANSNQTFHCIGHSLGGLVAQHIAIHAPQRLKSLILISTWDGDSPPKLVKTFKNILTALSHQAKEPLLDTLRPPALYSQQQGPGSAYAIMQAAQSEFPVAGLINQTKAEINCQPLTTQLSAITCPTLIIHGDHDRYFSLTSAQTLHANIAHSSLEVIKDCGHMPMIEKPKVLNRLILQHIERCS